MPYIRVTNIDLVATKRVESNWLYATLQGFNRKAIEVQNWVNPIGINNSTGYGIFVIDAGEYTFFRKFKADGKTDWQNYTVDCRILQNELFILSLVESLPTFNFKVSIQLVDLGENPITNFEYGFSLLQNEIISNWRDSNTFDLVDEGVYFFDVRVKGQGTSIGKQSIELYLNDASVPTTGGEDGDNPMLGVNSGE